MGFQTRKLSSYAVTVLYRAISAEAEHLMLRCLFVLCLPDTWSVSSVPSCRWIRLGSKRLGWRRCSSLPEILTWWSHCDSDSSSWSFPPLAWETLCRWADTRAVPDVHPVQSHEWGFSLPPGNDGLSGGNRDASSQTGVQNKQWCCWVTAINTLKSEPQTSTVVIQP